MGTEKKLDGWINLLTSLGVSGRDKRTGARPVWNFMTEGQQEELYAADDLGAKIVDKLPDEGVREWITFKCEDSEMAKNVSLALDDLDVKEKMNQAWKWARLYGGAGILMLVDDNMDMSMPLNPERVIRLRGLVVLSRYELQHQRVQEDIMMPNFNMPDAYSIQGRAAMSGSLYNQEIHYSRILRFDGVKLPRLLHVQNQYWGDSIFSRLYNALRNYQSSYDSATAALQDFSVSVYKIKELANLIASGQEEIVKKRLQIVELSKSLIRAMILDSEEEFSHQTRALTGVPELLDRIKDRLAAAVDIPTTVLFGDSPTGIGGSGRHEQQNWYDYVSSQQEIVLMRPLNQLLKVLLSSKQGPTNGKLPEGWDFEFNPLWQIDQIEETKDRKVQAEIDQIYISQGVLDPSEVAVSRFGGAQYSKETQIDLEMREEQKYKEETKEKEGKDVDSNEAQDS